MGIFDIKINSVRETDKEKAKDSQVSNRVKVINVSDREYAGIAPNEIGEIDVSKWGPYQFALKKVRSEPKLKVEKPASPAKEKEEEKKVQKKKAQPKKKQTKRQTRKASSVKNKLILLKAFVEAAGGTARAAILLSVERSTLIRWLNSTRLPRNANVSFDGLIEHLDELEKPIFKEKVLELCQTKSKITK